MHRLLIFLMGLVDVDEEKEKEDYERAVTNFSKAMNDLSKELKGNHHHEVKR